MLRAFSRHWPHRRKSSARYSGGFRRLGGQAQKGQFRGPPIAAHAAFAVSRRPRAWPWTEERLDALIVENAFVIAGLASGSAALAAARLLRSMLRGLKPGKVFGRGQRGRPSSLSSHNRGSGIFHRSTGPGGRLRCNLCRRAAFFGRLAAGCGAGAGSVLGPVIQNSRAPAGTSALLRGDKRVTHFVKRFAKPLLAAGSWKSFRRCICLSPRLPLKCEQEIPGVEACRAPHAPRCGTKKVSADSGHSSAGE